MSDVVTAGDIAQQAGASSFEEAARRKKAGEPSGTQTPSRKPSAASRKGDIKAIEEALEQLFGMGAIVFQMRGDQFCAQYMLTNATLPARAWAKLAAQNEAVYRILVSLTQGGAWVEAIMTTAAFTIPMLAHHGRVPRELAGVFGVQVPEPESVVVPNPNVERPAEVVVEEVA